MSLLLQKQEDTLVPATEFFFFFFYLILTILTNLIGVKKGQGLKGDIEEEAPPNLPPTPSPGSGVRFEILDQVVPIVHYPWVVACLATPIMMWSLKSSLIDTVPSRVSICPVSAAIRWLRLLLDLSCLSLVRTPSPVSRMGRSSKKF